MLKPKISVVRMTQIVNVLFKLGFYSTINKIGVTSYLPFHKRLNSDRKEIISPKDLREIFENLGGAFVKLGQLLAMRPDLIGSKYSSELEKLLDHTKEFPFEEFKEKVSDLKDFKINKKPLGSASISQVYKAKHNGKNVVIKLKKPFIDEIFNDDIKIMEYFIPKIQKHLDIGFVDLEDIVQEFKEYTLKELDFQNEANNIKVFEKKFEKSKNIIIPKVYDEFSTSDRIVMEYVSGKNILQIKEKNKKYIRIISNSVYEMIFEHKIFHADLHSGNIFFKDDKIIYLDFGIVGRIDDVLEEKLFALFSSLVYADSEGAANALVDLHIGKGEVDERILSVGISEVLGPYYDCKISQMDFKKIFYGAIEVARKSKIKLSSDLILFGKSLVTMEGFCKKIDPNFNVVKEARPFVKKVMKEKTSLKNLKKEGTKSAMEFMTLFSKFPKRVSSFSRKFNVIEKQIVDIDENISEFKYLFRNMTKIFVQTIIFFSFFMGAVLLIDLEPLFFGYSFFSITLIVLCLYLVLKIHRNLEKIF